MEKNQPLNFEGAMTAFIACTKAQQLAILANMVSKAEAEEILQEAYLKVYLLVKKNPNNEQTLAQFMALQPLLFSIVKNLAISNIRHQKVVDLHYQKVGKSTFEDEYGVLQSSESELMKKDQEALLLQAINHLPPICRQVFVQRKLYSKSHGEIAAILGISTRTVESHLAKGLVLCRSFVRNAKQQGINRLRDKAI